MADLNPWDELAEADAAGMELPPREGGSTVLARGGATQVDELPLWTEEGNSEPTTDRSATENTSLPDLKAQLGEVAAAWQEIVPAERGTAEDLRAVLEADVQALQVRWQSVAAAPRGGGVVVANGDADRRADAVNAALRDADRQAPALHGVPEWQELRAVRGEVGRLWRSLAAQAGEFAERLFRDRRVSEFLRNVSIRACETIASLAQSAADRLRRGRTALPSAEVLLALGNSANSYATSAWSHGRLPTAEALLASGISRQDRSPARTDTEVDIPGLVALGRALRKPGPGSGVSAVAARLRSGGDQVRPGAPAGDEAKSQGPGVTAQACRRPRQR
ncbi:hypothetical protein [Streptomyces sp. NRRL WC-3742]|uniref:hypothetical protein n=1 Tax=Streptomyces sp. NRRL WC-3742 TaxID=1463934 RepID=UPI00131D2B05|nr:hypothetical protein [Streptomyces sp. NRRL WC-3742]